jgi:uncharacterized protein (DUF1778 family)
LGVIPEGIVSLYACQPIEGAILGRGQTMTEFVVQSACAVAEIELAEQKEFTLPPAQWQAFLAALDKPTEFNPALHRLLTEQSVIELANKKK